MQTPQQQHQYNLVRLQIYRAKQTDEQRRLAHIAEQVSIYSKNLGLNLLQTSVAIRIAQKQLRNGCSEQAAYKASIQTAQLIAQATANQKLNAHRRRTDGLH